MKVIFLDFDGVLNTPQTWAHHDKLGLDVERVALLQSLCELTGAVVVISSTWRMVHALEDLRVMLAERGFRGEVIGATPALLPKRSDEIRAWLDDHHEVTHYVVLDDSRDAGIPEQTVLTNFKEGLTPVVRDRAAGILARQARATCTTCGAVVAHRGDVVHGTRAVINPAGAFEITVCRSTRRQEAAS
ncbi:MAG: HAD domain-containing protein [Vicinamibacterales bacterium]